MNIRKILITASAALVLAALPAAASAKGGYGVVTPFFVGPLTMNGSTASDVQGFAGRPDRVTYQSGPAFNNAGVWKTFIYRFPSHGLTEYTFNQFPDGTWYLEQFYSTLQRFRTPGGTKVGMSRGQAQSREHLAYSGGCVASGLWRNTTDGNGNYYGSVVDLGCPARRVVDLQTFGPYQLPC
jgi:hypothetical protein